MCVCWPRCVSTHTMLSLRTCSSVCVRERVCMFEYVSVCVDISSYLAMIWRLLDGQMSFQPISVCVSVCAHVVIRGVRCLWWCDIRVCVCACVFEGGCQGQLCPGKVELSIYTSTCWGLLVVHERTADRWQQIHCKHTHTHTEGEEEPEDRWRRRRRDRDELAVIEKQIWSPNMFIG